MTRIPAARGAALLAVPALVVAALAGCSALDPNGPVQACAALGTAIPDMTSKLQEASSQAQQDPATAVATLKDAKSTFDDKIAELKNADIKASATSASDALGDLTAKVEAAAADPLSADTAAVQAAVTTTQEKFGQLGKKCTPGS